MGSRFTRPCEISGETAFQGQDQHLAAAAAAAASESQAAVAVLPGTGLLQAGEPERWTQPVSLFFFFFYELTFK